MVRFVVDEISDESLSVDVLHAIETRKRPVALEGPQITDEPLLVAGHTVSIAEFLDYVNYYFPDVLPKDVLNHYGYDQRPKGDRQAMKKAEGSWLYRALFAPRFGFFKQASKTVATKRKIA